MKRALRSAHLNARVTTTKGTAHSTTEGRSPSKEEHTMTFQNEREEIAAIAEMLTDGEDIYYLLGTARGLLKLEAKKEKAQ